MAKQSAGILLYKKVSDQLFFLLAHPGGPFWTNKDDGSWSIPKGEFTAGENALDAAIREFEEETSVKVSGNFIELEPVKLKSGKIIYAFALEKDIAVADVKSNDFEMEWPPKSGTIKQFPEIDRAEWFPFEVAVGKINATQADFIIQTAKIAKR